jgi:hypothetical protein
MSQSMAGWLLAITHSLAIKHPWILRGKAIKRSCRPQSDVQQTHVPALPSVVGHPPVTADLLALLVLLPMVLWVQPGDEGGHCPRFETTKGDCLQSSGVEVWVFVTSGSRKPDPDTDYLDLKLLSRSVPGQPVLG